MSLLDRLMARARDVRTQTVDADGIAVTVREPSAAIHAQYVNAMREGDGDVAMAGLLRYCVVDDLGAPCLSAEQAITLARSGSMLTMPLVNAIFEMALRQKKSDAPGADAVPDRAAAGAATE